MKAIVAIGGGDFKLGETIKIDKYIVSLANKKNPKLLFIPTASNDSIEYCDQIKDYFGHFGCTVDSLLLFSEANRKIIKEKILNADISYVGGGDTTVLINKWREMHVDTYLVQAYERGTIMSGLSAGAICWFNEGFVEPDPRLNSGIWCFEDAHCLGLINGYCCPHYNQGPHELFDRFIAKNNQIGYGIEDATAIISIDDELSVMTCNDWFDVKVLKPHYYGMDKEEYKNGDKIIIE